MIELFIPLRIESVTNLREHWSKKHKRHKVYKTLITSIWRTLVKTQPTPPLNIKLTRIAPRTLDRDNLVSALKHPTDVIADLIIPGLKPGRADDPAHGLHFEYAQEKRPKTYGLLVEIETPHREDLCVGQERISGLSHY